MDMQCQHKAQWLMIFGLFFHLILTSNWACHAAALSSDQVSNVGSGDGRIFGCLPCSQAYLASSYFDHRNSLLESDFHDFLAQEFGTGDLCRGLANDMNVLGLADLHRHLSGEGSHRHVVSALTFVNQSDAFLDAAVFGDSNLELLQLCPTDQLLKFTWILGMTCWRTMKLLFSYRCMLDIRPLTPVVVQGSK